MTWHPALSATGIHCIAASFVAHWNTSGDESKSDCSISFKTKATLETSMAFPADDLEAVAMIVFGSTLLSSKIEMSSFPTKPEAPMTRNFV